MSLSDRNSANICRFCIKHNAILQSIFTETMSFPNKILLCTSLQVTKGDGLPEVICKDCIGKLSIAYEFRITCHESEAHLKQQLICFNSETDNLFKAESQLFDLIYSDNSTDIQQSPIKSEIKTDLPEVFADMLIVEGENMTTIKKVSKLKSKKRNVNSVAKKNIENILNNSNDAIVLSKDKPRIKRRTKKAKKNKNTSGSDTDDLKEQKGFNFEVIEAGSTSNDISKLKPKRIRKPKQCQVCGKICIWLRTHMLTHTGVKAFKCEHCAKSFTQLSHYKCHLNIHTGNKPYLCDICGKGFADPASKRSHLVTHTKERKYKCNICEKTFGYSHTLSAHRKTHTQDRKHVCTVCQKPFLSKYGLTKHFRIHTGEKPYKCEFCDKRFSTSGNIQTHKRIHTRERPYKCNICDMTFAYKSVLNTHEKKHLLTKPKPL